jgi:hypothetical protein
MTLARSTTYAFNTDAVWKQRWEHVRVVETVHPRARATPSTAASVSWLIPDRASASAIVIAGGRSRQNP